MHTRLAFALATALAMPAFAQEADPTAEDYAGLRRTLVRLSPQAESEEIEAVHAKLRAGILRALNASGSDGPVLADALKPVLGAVNAGRPDFAVVRQQIGAENCVVVGYAIDLFVRGDLPTNSNRYFRYAVYRSTAPALSACGCPTGACTANTSWKGPGSICAGMRITSPSSCKPWK